MTRLLSLEILLIAVLGLSVVGFLLTRPDIAVERNDTARPPPVVRGCIDPAGG